MHVLVPEPEAQGHHLTISVRLILSRVFLCPCVAALTFDLITMSNYLAIDCLQMALHDLSARTRSSHIDIQLVPAPDRARWSQGLWGRGPWLQAMAYSTQLGVVEGIAAQLLQTRRQPHC